MNLAALPLGYTLLLAGLIGLTVGSFLNVLALRLPRKLYAEHAAECADDDTVAAPDNRWFGLNFLIAPASSCPHCGSAIRAWHNIPVIGWLWLRGRCADCAAPISPRYPIVEAITGLLSVSLAWHFGPGPHLLPLLVLLWGLIVLTIIDLDEQLLPDVLTLPLLWLGLLVNLDGGLVSLHDAVLGASAGYLTLWLVFQLFRLATGKEGMGYGDFKLFALFGAWLGWQMLPVILLLSSVVGAVVGIALVLVRGRDHQIPIPFGPYLAGAGLIALFWGQQIIHQYLQLSGLN